MSRLELLSSGHLRVDGRRPLELRSLVFHLSPPSLRQAGPDGSAIVTQGLTTVHASVFGPRQRGGDAGAGQQQQQGGQAGLMGSEAKLEIEVEMPPWAEGEWRKRSKGDRRLNNLASSLQSAFSPCVLLHLYPRSVIRVYLSIGASDGSLFSACVNAISLALLDAGISLLEPLVSITIGFYAGGGGDGAVEDEVAGEDSAAPGGTLLLDLNRTEESSLPSITLGIMPRTGTVSLLELETRLHLDRLKQAIRLGVEACDVLKEEMDSVVKARTRTLAKALGGKGVPNARDPAIDPDVDQVGEDTDMME